MKAKRLLKLLVPAIAVTMGISSCQDYDADFTEKSIQYTDEFKKAFGDIDPNQDWSMAKQVSATIKVPGADGATLRIMTASPMSRNCYMLAERTLNGTAELNLDVVKGAKSVYVEVKTNSGRYLVDGYFDIVDGKVSVEKSYSTRAATNPSPVTVTKYTPSSTNAGDGEGTVGWAGVSTKAGTTLVPYPIEWEDESANKYYDSGWGYDLYNTTNIKNAGNTSIGNFYLINNMDLSEKTAPWKLREMYPLYFYYTSTKDGTNKSGPFLEGQNNIIKYFSKTAQAQEYPLDKDAYFITEGGPVELALYGKGTECSNDVGYFYYPKAKEAEYMRADGTLDFDKVKKFVMLQNMSSKDHNLMVGTNLYNFSMKSSYNTGDFQTGVRAAETGKKDEYDTYNPEYHNFTVESAKIKLTYFGDDDPLTASPDYDFPANYVIGFFGIRNGEGVASNRHLYCSFASVELNYFNDYPRGASFKYKGYVYLGIEDDTDYDHNDYLFRVAGVDASKVIDVTPEDDPDYVPEPTYQTWTVACEDLGGYFDYDFNDLVFGLRMTDNVDGTTKKLELIPLAAGGTLEAHIYYDGADKGEIHNLVTPGADYTSPINVNAGSNPGPGAAVTLEESTTDDINAVMANISIKVIKENATNSSYNIGYDYEKGNTSKKAPQVILFPAGWDWPSEGTFICDVYPKFAQWVSNVDVTTWCNDRTGNGGFVNCPFSEVVPTPTDPEEHPVTPPVNPGKSANNLNIVQNVTINLPADGGTGSVVDHYTTSSTGKVTAVSNNDKVTVVVDQENKTITLSATEVVNNVTVTVTQAADDDYEAGTKTITVKAIDPSAGPSFTIGGNTISAADISHTGTGSVSYMTGDYVYTIDKKYFTDNISKITVTLTSISDTKLNAAVMSDGKFSGLKDSPTGTAVITSTDDINTIKNSGLTIIDWAIPYPTGCDKIGSVAITIE